MYVCIWGRHRGVFTENKNKYVTNQWKYYFDSNQLLKIGDWLQIAFNFLKLDVVCII